MRFFGKSSRGAKVADPSASPQKTNEPETLVVHSASPSSVGSNITSSLRRFLHRKNRKEALPSHGSASPDGSGPTRHGLVARSHTPDSTTDSLWDRAYDALKAESGEKVEEYEELLSRELQDTNPPPPDAVKNRIQNRQSRREALCAVSKQGLQRMEGKKLKYTIAGHEIVLEDQIAQASDLVLWAQDWISTAVNGSPEASVAWAGVCLVLPLLTNPKTAEEANRDGFTYVTTRMDYYTALEPILLRVCKGSGTPEDLAVEVQAQAHIIELYKKILDFQIRSVLRFFRSRVGNLVRDGVRNEKWEDMRQAIVDLEGTVRQDLTQTNDLQSREELEHLNNTAAQSLKTMQQFLSVSEEHLQVSRDQLQLQREMYKHTLSQEERQCHHLFRLTAAIQDVTYEWYKGRVEERVEGTCKWFLTHEYFQTWLGQDSGSLLVSADPGCGKSVLSKYLIDKELPKYGTVCYFFFKDQDQDQNRINQALCAILHQLFCQSPFLIRHAMQEYSNNGPGLINATASLWKILEEAVQDPQAGTVIIVLDALDECEESNRRNLVKKLTDFYGNRSIHGKIKHFLTSRPYQNILEDVQDLLDSLPNVHIPGDTKSDAISEEVNLVIKHKIEKLATRIKLKEELQDHLTNQLLEMTHRTYLWVYLIFDYLETSGFKKTKNGIELAVATLPENVNQAYELILSKSAEEHMVVRKVLSIILAASRPLTIAEMNIAVNTDNSTKSIRYPDLEKEDDFKSHLRSWCGLFVSIHHDKVYFLHQTAREFLLSTSSPHSLLGNEPLLSSSPGLWKSSISIENAHETLAEICLIYLNFFNYCIVPPFEYVSYETIERLHRHYCFLEYSAMNWSKHFRAARIGNNHALIYSALAVCDSDSVGHPLWLHIWWGYIPPQCGTALMIASESNHESIVKLMLDRGANVDSRDTTYGRTPLSWAALRGQKALVELFLDNSANIEARDDEYGQTPLLLAVEGGHRPVVELLLDRGASIESKDTKRGQTSLSCAARRGNEAVVKFLLDLNADIESKDIDHRHTPLSWAAENGHTAVVKLLLDRGANADFGDSYGRTPLLLARNNGHEEVVQLLQKATGAAGHRDV